MSRIRIGGQRKRKTARIEISEDQIDHAEDDKKADDENDADDPEQKFDHEALLLAMNNAREDGWVRRGRKVIAEPKTTQGAAEKDRVGRSEML
jgi:hypothetical protein